jgi:hypothetical protein
MDWNVVSAIAQVVATVGVIVSLIYVAIQVKQNSKLIDQSILATRSATVHGTSVSFSRIYELLAQDSELCDIYQRGIRGETLTDNETGRFESLIFIYVAWLEDADFQETFDLFFDEDDTDPVEGMDIAFKPLLSSPIGREWWSKIAEDFTTPSLYRKITGLMAQWDANENQC